PYCHLLFPREVLQSFCTVNALDPIDFDDVNGWSVERFRALWESQERMLRPVVYEENWDLSWLPLIEQHPPCFRSKTDNFENLIVTSIVALFQKSASLGKA